MKIGFLEKIKGAVKIDGYFIFLWIVFAFTASFILIVQCVSYQSEMVILVIPKNEKIAASSSEVTGNLAEVSETLFFYEKLLRNNPDLNDEWEFLSKDERKKMWNNKIETVHEPESTTLILRISDRSQVKSNLFAKKATDTLFDLASRYYNIKSDIDLRIVEGPITEVVLNGWYWIIFLSLLIGAFLSWLVQLFFVFIEKMLSTKPSLKFPAIKIPEIKKSGKNQKKELEKLIEGYAEKETNFFIAKEGLRFRKNNPPENLPVAFSAEMENGGEFSAENNQEEAIAEMQFGANNDASENKKEEDEDENDADAIPEPTAEDFKKRLNQLLKGDL
ncbi:MAG: Uncharacterized protein Athens101428_143 [Candidatus Berkelbacteria bacterium Athens1014_28]|uniref:Uncharacterized protein n=1 Tax=Candidatus Berkelbacteria bacterium Athens1014_28 TaxID=2017145 RepID=A0A554LPQ3_9BACT|nr:MAG: Uncharacterized protein Athens101428_143 [Candidatus Berkelbacteria bacterium Athens1014_28]